MICIDGRIHTLGGCVMERRGWAIKFQFNKGTEGMSTPPRRSFISNRAWNPERAIVPHAARWYARTARTYVVSAYLSSYQSEGRSIRSFNSFVRSIPLPNDESILNAVRRNARPMETILWSRKSLWLLCKYLKRQTDLYSYLCKHFFGIDQKIPKYLSRSSVHYSYVLLNFNQRKDLFVRTGSPRLQKKKKNTKRLL